MTLYSRFLIVACSGHFHPCVLFHLRTEQRVYPVACQLQTSGFPGVTGTWGICPGTVKRNYEWEYLDFVPRWFHKFIFPSVVPGL